MAAFYKGDSWKLIFEFGLSVTFEEPKETPVTLMCSIKSEYVSEIEDRKAVAFLNLLKKDSIVGVI